MYCTLILVAVDMGSSVQLESDDLLPSCTFFMCKDKTSACPQQ